MALSAYNKKRNFKATPEPTGKTGGKNMFRFVVQRHDASRLHYDFRLELGGVLKSWAVPKGPSLNPSYKRLAVMVEDHPVSYIHFEGIIPEGNYGAGTVEVWDKGAFIPVDKDLEPITERQALSALKNGELKIFLKGEKIAGGFVLVRMKQDDKNWLLIKHQDEYSITRKYDSEVYSKNAAKSRIPTKRSATKKNPAKKKAVTGTAKKTAQKKK
jgi:bifunctional non-homologous end joining protein LigD